MSYLSQPSRSPRRRRSGGRGLALAGLALAGLVAGAGLLAHRDPRSPARDEARNERPARAIAAAAPADIRWLDPRPYGTEAPTFVRAGPPIAGFRAAAAQTPVDEVATAAVTVAAVVAQPPPAARFADAVPLPVPRPAEFAAPRPTERLAERPVEQPRPSRRGRLAALPAPAEDPGFFEKLFGLAPAPSPGPALSYASVGTPSLGRSPSLGRLDPGPSAGGTAVYDITARTVTLPSGERLEAHSGLGDKMDDPRHVNVRMRGATPPGIYDLTERERLFHGVRAIRLNPVGGSAAIHGRDGLLAHTYMLGPRGDSNGCVSFRNYDRFLQAYLRGEVRRLVVVAGDSGLPRLAGDSPARGRASSDRDG